MDALQIDSISPQLLFYFNVAVIVLLGVSFFSLTSKKLRPTPLKLGKTSAKASVPAASEPERAQAMRSVNVIFMFNAHAFDAHEVLGLPAGARRQAIDEAYVTQKSRLQGDRLELIEAAYAALKSQS